MGSPRIDVIPNIWDVPREMYCNGVVVIICVFMGCVWFAVISHGWDVPGEMYGNGVIGMNCFFMEYLLFHVIPNGWDVPGRGTMLRVSFYRCIVVFDNDASCLF